MTDIKIKVHASNTYGKHGTTPGMKFDSGKLPYHLIDPDAEAEMVAVLGFGAEKYEPWNWVNVNEAKDRFFGAVRRHLAADRRGDKIDPETGLLALASVVCSAHFLLALELRTNPDLVASLPTRFAGALEKARALRAKRGASVAGPLPEPRPAVVWTVKDKRTKKILGSGLAPTLMRGRIEANAFVDSSGIKRAVVSVKEAVLGPFAFGAMSGLLKTLEGIKPKKTRRRAPRSGVPSIIGAPKKKKRVAR